MKIGILRHLALEEEGEENLDTEETLEEEPPVDPGTDVPNEEEAADAPIEYPDVGNLEVDKVATQLAEDEQARTERVDDALEATEQLNAAVESMQAALRVHGTLTPTYAKNASAALAAVRDRLGFPTASSKFAMEDYALVGPAESVIALEGYKETLSAIFRAVLAAIAAAVQWLKKAFINFFIGIEHDLKVTKSLTAAILQLRGDEEKGKLAVHRRTAVQDDLHYVALAGNKRLLTLNGLQPNEMAIPAIDSNRGLSANLISQNWPQALDRILGLAKQHATYQKWISEDLLSAFSGYFSNAVADSAGNQAIELPPFVFNPISFVSDTTYFSGPVKPIPALAGCIFATDDFFLGSFKVVTRCSAKIALTASDSMTIMADWHTEIQAHDVVLQDSWMRFFSSAELKDASSVVVDIAHELLAYEKTVDKVRDVEEKLKAMATDAASTLAKVPADYFDKSATNGWRGAQLTLGLRAINGVISNVNRSLFEYSSRAGMTCKAWNHYLSEIYAKEKKMLKGP